MINALELVSISDFALSMVCLFLAGLTLGNGKTNKSPDKFLGYFILFVGLSAFMGGLNHGFFEPLHRRSCGVAATDPIWGPWRDWSPV